LPRADLGADRLPAPRRGLRAGEGTATTRDGGRRPGWRVAVPGEGSRPYRLENWKLLRAFLWPYFLRSTIRASRVRKLFSRRLDSRSGRSDLRARARPRATAPDWLCVPLPETLTNTSMRPGISVLVNGARTSLR